MVRITLTEAELQMIMGALDDAREELEELMREEEWYVTEVNERCQAAYTILKNIDKEQL
jgi:lipopolysaccharide biosynthesis regulator YciM